jgi:hypothetical protein
VTNFLKGMSGHQRANPLSVDWLTPPEIVRALGPFDLDPCASCSQLHELSGTMQGIGATRYCKCDNGLEKPWKGFVWMNPPYGQEIGAWMAKLAKHGQGIALVFARTETGWFQDSVLVCADALFFIAGRIRFYRPDGTPGNYTGGAPSVLVAYGELALDRLKGLQMRGNFVNLISNRERKEEHG